MKVLLHTCCGPCASACVPALRDLGNEVSLFFSNSNIDTEAEFEKRLDNARTLAAAEGVELAADAYDHADWLERVAKGFEDEPEKGARCARCFRYNLARTAAYAAAHGYDAFTTSLTVSPHKVSRMVFEAGADAAWSASAKECGGSASAVPEFLPVDFKKKDGFLRSLRRAEELGLYRQSYCGCEFSRRNVV
jgi:predicted adenine nucleotide alpha hydrolase (AANH) superfamily ATPase